MSTTISYLLKLVMPTLTQDNRWNVLTVLILHANIRNRCYVGMDTIAELATNGNLTKATRAKKWLDQHGAYELVPHEKRVAEERDLPKRQHLYQLTGVLRCCTDALCECQKWARKSIFYLYYGKDEADNPNVLTIENIRDVQSSDHSELNRAKVLTIDNFNGQNVSTSSSIPSSPVKPSNKNTVAPNGAGGSSEHPARKPVFRSEVFKLVALESFGISDVDGIAKDTVVLINKIIGWLKGNSPGATVETLKAFYAWYDKTITAARPRDSAKFGAHFDAFKQQHLIARKPPPEVIRQPNAVAHEFGVNEFVREVAHD